MGKSRHFQWDRNSIDTDLGNGSGYKRWFYSLAFNNDHSMWTASLFYGTDGVFIYSDVFRFDKTHMDIYVKRPEGSIETTLTLQYTIIALGF